MLYIKKNEDNLKVEEKYYGAGDLDSGFQNHLDPNKRFFNPK